MALRKWQAECANRAVDKYLSGQQHFFCLATPGAGKTLMAADVAKKLFAQSKIDFVVCFSPSIATAKGMQATLEATIEASLNGQLGAKGTCVTYQSLNHKDNAFWNVFRQFRIFAIFDEIHHCGGNDINDANVWAQHILANVQSHAKYTMALSGTPWRSDKRPVTLSSYCDQDGSIYCDYEYGLTEAISENVCRIPHVTVIDNNQISVTSNEQTPEIYGSIKDVLQQTLISYQAIVESDPIIEFCLEQANKELRNVRSKNPKAAGLVVASTVEHAEKIAQKLKLKYSKSVEVVTYRNTESDSIISRFQNTNTEWLVSVGMVSEGTDIPRLQVCCHLTRIKTELHFRQILGRIMRLTHTDKSKRASLFAPAQPQLIEFARRLLQDIPSQAASIKIQTDPTTINISEVAAVEDITPSETPQVTNVSTLSLTDDEPSYQDLPTLTETFLSGLGFDGQFSKHSIVNS